MLTTTALTQQEEDLIDLFYDDVHKYGLSSAGFPVCPQGGKCECPNAKVAAGFGHHHCSPDPKDDCIVRVHIFAKGLRV